MDESAGSSLGNPPPELIDLNPFASSDGIQGFLQYLPLAPGKPQAVRAILAPDQRDSEMEMLEMPQRDESGRMNSSNVATS
jgi:hypothetical protein